MHSRITYKICETTARIHTKKHVGLESKSETHHHPISYPHATWRFSKEREVWSLSQKCTFCQTWLSRVISVASGISGASGVSTVANSEDRTESFLKKAMPSAGGKYKHGEDIIIWSASSLPLTWPTCSQPQARQLSYLLCPSPAPAGWRKRCHLENLNMRNTKWGEGREKTKQGIKLWEKPRKVEFNIWGKCPRKGKNGRGR